MTLQLYDDPQLLDSLRSTWAALLEETPRASFFQSLPWLQAYWEHFGAGQQLRVWVVRDQGQPTGILPWVIRSEWTKVGTVRFLTYPLDYWGSFYGPLGKDPPSVLAEGLAELSHRRRDWDVLELRWLGVHPGELEETRNLLRQAGYACTVSQLDTTGIIQIQGTWSDYLASRSSKWRNNLKRWVRRLDQVGTVRYERYRSEGLGGDPRWDLYDTCQQLASRSWQGSSTSGTTISHPQVSAFIRDAHQAAADHGGLDMNLLYVDGRPAAFTYNYTYRGHVFGLRAGYDPALKSHGVGSVLYARIIEDSFQRGDWRYDLGPGSLEAKRRLCTEFLPIFRLSSFQTWSVRQQLLRWKRRRDAQQLPAQTCCDAAKPSSTPGEPAPA